MHDIRLIRDDPAAFDAALARRGLEPMAERLVALDEQRRAAIGELQAGQTRRNEASKAIGQAKAAKDEATASALMAEVAALKERLPALEAEEKALQSELDGELAAIPNLPLPDVPEGASEEENELVAEHGPQPHFAFAPREHDAIGPALGLDFETGVAIAGARFTLIRGSAAKLHRALGQFMLDRLTQQHGYEEVVPPLLVRDEAVFGTGQLPKFAEDLFATDVSLDPFDYFEFKRRAFDSWMNARGLNLQTAPSLLEKEMWNALPDPNTRRWLIPTAEVSLTNIVRETILPEAALPLRFTALTPCFRSEAGAAGRDTRGLIRQHQFEKAEMVSITTPDQSDAEHERMTQCAEDILTALGLPFRRMKLCTGDMGFSAARTYDLEVWLPGQGRYREISSCSTCTDFQARRMNARYRYTPPSVLHQVTGKAASATRFVHTLNGSGLAVGRTLVAVIENYQQEDGGVAVPEALLPYLGGMNRLEPRT